MKIELTKVLGQIFENTQSVISAEVFNPVRKAAPVQGINVEYILVINIVKYNVNNL